MNTVILSANVGGIDEVYGMPKQNTPCDHRYYFDHNLPCPMPNLNNRLKAKYCKLQTHRFLNHSTFIWHDSRIKIISKDFASIFKEQLSDYDMVIFRHEERESPYKEIEYILENIESGNNYLLSRYGNQQISKEIEFMVAKGIPEDTPLYHCNLFARRNNKKVNAAFDEWWKLCLEYSYFDQALFSFIAWKYELKINSEPLRDPFKIYETNPHL